MSAAAIRKPAVRADWPARAAPADGPVAAIPAPAPAPGRLSAVPERFAELPRLRGVSDRGPIGRSDMNRKRFTGLVVAMTAGILMATAVSSDAAIYYPWCARYSGSSSGGGD